MGIRELFKGFVVIIDDLVDTEMADGIKAIKGNLESNGYPAITFSEIPDEKFWSTFSHASFIILDWVLYDNLYADVTREPDEPMIIPETIKAKFRKKNIEFLKAITSKYLTPVFIFTKEPESVREELGNEGLWKDDKSTIFIKGKTELQTEEDLFSAIAAWTKNVPAAYVLKEWEQTAERAKEVLFRDLYHASPNWVSVIFKTLEIDSRDSEFEFGSFISKQFMNRIEDYSFDREYLSASEESPFDNKDELQTVLERERYISIQDKGKQSQAYTGDLFLRNDKYYLNIRAQCDLARSGKDGTYNPKLYLIAGDLISLSSVQVGDIKISESELIVGSWKIGFDQLPEECGSGKKRKRINEKLSPKSKRQLIDGTIIEKSSESIIAFIDQGKIIAFSNTIEEITCFDEMKQYLIGRIPPPYITRIQQRVSSYIFREGVLRLPDEAF